MTLPYLISAVNVLSEAEVSYKQARNKKLHVELALIKLTYLGQALELTGEGADAGKKKRVDGTKAIAFRQIPFFSSKAFPGKTDSAKLTVQEPRSVSGQQSAVSKGLQPSSQLPVASSQKPVASSQTPIQNPESSPRPTMGALQKIRRDIATRANSDAKAIQAITENSLKEAWENYTEKLQEQKNHSAVTNFRLAILKVTGEHSFDVVTESNIQQKFIDQERAALVDHLKSWFNNMLISYQVVVEEQPGDGTPVERPLTMKEQYIRLIEEYPVVKELRDRLNLGLDY
jgi:DNA polymerase-3 subunit gamma/tau